MGGLDVARGLAVGMVVLLHASLLPQAQVDIPQPICRMALLLLISGAVGAPGATRHWAHGASRACDLLWLLMVWTPIVLIAQGDAASIWSTGLELVRPTTHLWYIAGLAVLTTTVPFLRFVPAAAPLCLSGIAMGWHLAGGRTGVHGYDQFMHFAIFFYVGFYGRAWLFDCLHHCGKRVGVAALAALLAMPMMPIPHAAMTLGGAAALLLVAQGIASTFAGPAIAWFGRRTSDVYLTHVPLLMVMRRVIGPLDEMALMLLVIGVIAACLALKALAERVGLRWLYRRPQIGSWGAMRGAIPAWRTVDLGSAERIAR